MNKLVPFTKLVRLPNLIMILFVQYMVRFAFLYPTFKVFNLSLKMNEWFFFTFSIAFLFMAAGGYIINDYSDIEIDKVNRPKGMVIGNGYTPAEALELYWIVSLTGVVIGFWSCYEMGLPSLGILFFIYLSGLWFYSTMFRYAKLLGNTIVSLFLALVPFTAALVEVFADVRNHYWVNSRSVPSFIYYGIFTISAFAFLLNLARELVKDAEDMIGDEKFGCRSVPIVWGIPTTKIVVASVLLVVSALLCYLLFQAFKVNDMLSFGYILILILIPTILIIAGLYNKSTPEDFHTVSTWLKLLMVSGISYLFVFTYVLLHNL